MALTGQATMVGKGSVPSAWHGGITSLSRGAREAVVFSVSPLCSQADKAIKNVPSCAPPPPPPPAPCPQHLLLFSRNTRRWNHTVALVSPEVLVYGEGRLAAIFTTV